MFKKQTQTSPQFKQFKHRIINLNIFQGKTQEQINLIKTSTILLSNFYLTLLLHPVTVFYKNMQLSRFDLQRVSHHKSIYQYLKKQKGFYKGFGYNLISESTSIYIKLQHSWRTEKFLQKWAFFTFADIFTNPLRIIENRYILQNRLPEYRTYNNIFHMVKKLGFTNLFKGSYYHFYQNLIYASFSQYFETFTTSTLLGCYFLGSLLTYPALTSYTRLVCQSDDKGMLPQKFNSIIGGIKQILNTQGSKRLYSGYGLYTVRSLATILLVTSVSYFGKHKD